MNPLRKPRFPSLWNKKNKDILPDVLVKKFLNRYLSCGLLIITKYSLLSLMFKRSIKMFSSVQEWGAEKNLLENREEKVLV